MARPKISAQRRTSQRSKTTSAPRAFPQLKKALTGIAGFDEVTGGGLPAGRPTIVCGGPGCGKTMFAMEFLVRGATDFNEPGVLMTFEETGEEMTRNVESLGFHLHALVGKKKLFLDYVRVEPSEIQETGEYDLEGLFIRLQHAVDSIGAKRVVLDTLEAVFSGFSNAGLLRAEIRRLFRWLKDWNLTTVVTAERGEGALTRYGLEEYVSDCVISLDHRVNDQISTRRMRVVKYRGSAHGTDEYPFLIDSKGFSVLPLSAIRLNHKVSKERVSSGVKDLDGMLEGKGFYKGSSVLVSGTSGSGKSTLAAHFANQSCISGKRALYVAFEESAAQVTRNMRSVGIDLGHHIKKGLLHFCAWRPTQHGLEMHLLRIHDLVEQYHPEVVIIDPITNLISADIHEVHGMLMRLLDFLKDRQITAMFITLTANQRVQEQTEIGISSLTDTWILLRDLELNGERNRCLYVLKSRGMAHSNQIREFVLSSKGVRLLPAYVGAGTVYTGSARLAQEARERADAILAEQQLDDQRKQISGKRHLLESQIAALRSELLNGQAEFERLTQQQQKRRQRLALDQAAMGKIRGVLSAGKAVNS
ncbi:MAG: circadian clock protein KaiC [Acidobacteriota bacterium]|nr:circadian clock protein KaiC [Acidobacteriota bacterium]